MWLIPLPHPQEQGRGGRKHTHISHNCHIAGVVSRPPGQPAKIFTLLTWHGDVFGMLFEKNNRNKYIVPFTFSWLS